MSFKKNWQTHLNAYSTKTFSLTIAKFFYCYSFKALYSQHKYINIKVYHLGLLYIILVRMKRQNLFSHIFLFQSWSSQKYVRWSWKDSKMNTDRHICASTTKMWQEQKKKKITNIQLTFSLWYYFVCLWCRCVNVILQSGPIQGFSYDPKWAGTCVWPINKTLRWKIEAKN